MANVTAYIGYKGGSGTPDPSQKGTAGGKGSKGRAGANGKRKRKSGDLSDDDDGAPPRKRMYVSRQSKRALRRMRTETWEALREVAEAHISGNWEFITESEDSEDSGLSKSE